MSRISIANLVLSLAMVACMKEFPIEGDPTDATITNLNISAGSLAPAFDSVVTSYTLAVPYAVSTIHLSLGLAAPGANLKINGSLPNLGANSQVIAIAPGTNPITIEVTSIDLTATLTYSILVTRAAASADNDLTSLVLSPGVLSPTFSSATSSYSVLVSDLANIIDVTPTASHLGATLEVSWNAGAYRTVPSGIALASFAPALGINSLSVRVTSETGVHKTYDVTVTHALCGAGYFDDGTHACVPAGVGYFSLAGDNTRISCRNKPAHARYTSPTGSSASCPWSCNEGYLTTDGATCAFYPNATILSCNDNEVAVGLYGRSGAIIDRLGVRCAPLIDGEVGTVVRDGPYYGGTGGSPFSGTCATNQTAFEVDGSFATYSGEQRTGRIRFRCSDIVTQVLSAFSLAGSYWGGLSNIGPFNYACGTGANPNGSYINGIIIDNAGGANYVGKILGITCR